MGCSDYISGNIERFSIHIIGIKILCEKWVGKTEWYSEETLFSKKVEEGPQGEGNDFRTLLVINRETRLSVCM